MAEFKEVIAQAKRMCKEHPDTCNECPAKGKYIIDGGCLLYNCITNEANVETIESTVTAWAKEHPEPQYPSWEQWQKENFPDAKFPISLCHFTKAFSPFTDDVCNDACIACRKQPIPADIAKRLGIAPLKGEEE